MYKLESLKLTNFISHKHTEYKFRNGEAIIVVGENYDNPSQYGNGAGKSGVIEGIAMALTGECIRAASSKELVGRNWGDEAVIELHMYNTMFRNEVKIKRTLHVSKAQKIQLWVSHNDSFTDEQEEVYSDVNEYNKQILQLIGISKDDLFDFFLITKEHYKPFLTVGDTVKKAIINRFSGADKIDGVTKFIDDDVNDQTDIVEAIKAQINSIKGKQDVIADQIKEEEDKYSEETINARKVGWEDSIARKSNEVEGSKYMIQDYESELFEKRQQEKNFKINQYDTEIQNLQIRKDCIETQVSRCRLAIQDIRSIYTEEIKDLKELDQELKNAIKENKQTERDALSMQHDIHNHTLGLIECPKCQHQFMVKGEDDQDCEWDHYTAEELSQKLLDVKELIELVQKENVGYDNEKKACEKRLEEIEEEIFKKAENIKLEIVQLELEYNRISTKHQQLKKLKRELVTQLENIKDSILDVEAKLNRIQRTQNSLEKEIEELQELINKPSEESQLLEKLNDQLLTYLDQEVEYQEKLEEAVANKQAIEEWYTNFKNFKSHLANQSIKNIQDYTNMYLQQMGSDLSVQVDGYRMMSNKKLKEQITTVVLRNGFEEGSYGTFSGGERGRIDVCVILANQTLINLNCPSGGLDLLLADEIFDSIDSLGLECIINGLQSTRRTIMIVSQVQINSLADYTLLIRKQNKISTICQNVGSELTLVKTEESLLSTQKESQATTLQPQSPQLLVKKVKAKKSTNKG